ncbi:MAG: AMIN domain-containing protein, partial [Candidatus Electrothrix sp. AW5]|nr:AMIN domain-containing protein [Candidatus Electrothrix gigas]
VVCDFKNTVAAKNVPERLTTGGKYIQKIRIGKENKDNKVRVVCQSKIAGNGTRSDITDNF